MEAVILIPARFDSSRFPGKPLTLIAGKSLISTVYFNCLQSGLPTYVVTDDQRIEEHLKGLSAKVLRVDDHVVSGSERIALAFERFLSHQNFDYVINVQGDEPLLRAKTLRELVDFHAGTQFDMTTLVRQRLSSESDFHNPNIVKALISSHRALYFSRASIPARQVNDGEAYCWFQHVGVYCYSVRALQRFVQLSASHLEKLEGLEQLRALENQMSIGASLIDYPLIGVDNPEDIHEVEKVLS